MIVVSDRSLLVEPCIAAHLLPELQLLKLFKTLERQYPALELQELLGEAKQSDTGGEPSNDTKAWGARGGDAGHAPGEGPTWLGHGAMVSASGHVRLPMKSSSLCFGSRDLGSANGYYASRFSMVMGNARWYASDHMAEPADYLGTKMLEDCIEYMATAPDEGLKRKRSHPSSKGSKAAKAESANLLDIDKETDDTDTDSEEDEMEALDLGLWA
eukprot:Skav214858  [mRNA]  locus=scaffold16:475844:483571:+ [translate_table: standard]